MSGECNEHILYCRCKKSKMKAFQKAALIGMKFPDMINHPPHYIGKGLECIDVIEAFNLNFCLGNAIKYILRCSKKDDKSENLKKAIWYLNREIDHGC